MNEEQNSQFEWNKMKYNIFVQKNDVSNAMTQLFVTMDLKERFVETIKSFESGLGNLISCKRLLTLFSWFIF